jgi:hypothetical protein
VIRLPGESTVSGFPRLKTAITNHTTDATSHMKAEGADPAARKIRLPTIEIKAQKAFKRLDVIPPPLYI